MQCRIVIGGEIFLDYNNSLPVVDFLFYKRRIVMCPRKEYMSFIDGLVRNTYQTESRDELMIKNARFSDTGAHDEFNKLLESLNEDQRKIIAGILKEERLGVIHSVLAEISYLTTCKDLKILLGEKEVPTDISGMGINGDFVGRIEGWQWPEEE